MNLGLGKLLGRVAQPAKPSKAEQLRSRNGKRDGPKHHYDLSDSEDLNSDEDPNLVPPSPRWRPAARSSSGLTPARAQGFDDGDDDDGGARGPPLTSANLRAHRRSSATSAGGRTPDGIEPHHVRQWLGRGAAGEAASRSGRTASDSESDGDGVRAPAPRARAQSRKLAFSFGAPEEEEDAPGTARAARAASAKQHGVLRGASRQVRPTHARTRSSSAGAG
jgi:hypothetical protein